MNLSQLEVLVAIVETGSLKNAGEAVGLTSSAVSYSLSKLEAELGVTLLERSKQGITLTRIGEMVIQHGRTIISEVDIIHQITARERGLSIGKIRFACIPHVPPRLLAGIIRDFQHQYPDIKIVLFQGESREILEWLDNGIVDIGTVSDPGIYPHSVQLVESDVHVLLPKAHRLASQQTVSLDEILSEPIVGSRSEVESIVQMLPVSDRTDVDFRYQVSEIQTIYTMVAEGMGISILPKMLIDTEIGRITSKPIRPAITIQAYLATKVTSPANQAFFRIAQDWTQAHGFMSSDT